MPSDIGSDIWTENAAGNNATPPNGLPEGAFPSTVDDWARETMAAVKRVYDLLHPTLTTGGTSTAHTLTSATQAEAAYYSFVVNQTCGGTPRLNINGLGALSLRNFPVSSGTWMTLSAGDLQANQAVTARYKSSAPGLL